MKQFHIVFLNSFIGILKITCNGREIQSIQLTENQAKSLQSHPCAICENAICQIQEYLVGQRKTFNIPLNPSNGTDMQKKVWSYLMTIPYGKTISYSELAEAVNCKSIRAVATAVAKNPVPIIIPCHRVILKGGKIGNFSLGGSEVKRWLLSMEQSHS